MTTQNLGQIKALFSQANPPAVTNVIWFDTTVNKLKYFNANSSTWEEFIYPPEIYYGVTSFTNVPGNTNYTVTLNDSSLTNANLLPGYALKIKFNGDNTNPATISFNSQTPINIVKEGGNQLSAGDIKADTVYLLVYDGINFNLIGGVGGGSSAVQSYVVVPHDAATGDYELPVVNNNELIQIYIYDVNNIAQSQPFQVIVNTNQTINGLTDPLVINTDGGYVELLATLSPSGINWITTNPLYGNGDLGEPLPNDTINYGKIPVTNDTTGKYELSNKLGDEVSEQTFPIDTSVNEMFGGHTRGRTGSLYDLFSGFVSRYNSNAKTLVFGIDHVNENIVLRNRNNAGEDLNIALSDNAVNVSISEVGTPQNNVEIKAETSGIEISKSNTNGKRGAFEITENGVILRSSIRLSQNENTETSGIGDVIYDVNGYAKVITSITPSKKFKALNNVSKAITPTGTSINLNLDEANIWDIDLSGLTGNFTFDYTGDLNTFESYSFYFKQGSTGRVITFAPNKFAFSTVPPIFPTNSNEQIFIAGQRILHPVEGDILLLSELNNIIVS